LNAAEKSITVNAPVADVHERWLRFEELPKFIKSLGNVQWIDDTISHSAIFEMAKSSAASSRSYAKSQSGESPGGQLRTAWGWV